MTIVMVISIRRTMCPGIGISSVVTMFARKPVWAVLITVIAMFAVVLGGSLPAAFLMSPENPFRQFAGVVGTALAAVLLVWLLRRFVTRQPWSGLRLHWDLTAIPYFALGLAAGMAAVLSSSAASVALGVAQFRTFDTGGLPYVPILLLSIVAALIGQAFPEELLWRGHLYDTLPPRSRLITTSLVFGALHIISNGGQQGIAEHLLYVLQACALGFASGAARERTGSLWAAVGVHTGLHAAIRVLPTEGIQYGVQLVLQAATMTLAAVILLKAGRRAPATNRTTSAKTPAS